jgi:hypothetical protein
MNSFLLLIPFNYFRTTRLNNKVAVIFHLQAEWIPAVVILLLLRPESLSDSLSHFFLSYLTFICVYEIGYFVNDFFYTKKEENPRERLSNYHLTSAFVILFISIRLILFAFLSYNFFSSISFFVFYLTLAIVFTLHNLLRVKEYKVGTFINLAVLRFFAPFIFFISSAQTILLFPIVFLLYVFPRTLTYMDSKDLLQIPSRKTSQFKLIYYLLMLPICGWISLVQNHLIALVSCGYFIAFWIIAASIQKNLKVGIS